MASKQLQSDSEYETESSNFESDEFDLEDPKNTKEGFGSEQDLASGLAKTVDTKGKTTAVSKDDDHVTSNDGIPPWIHFQRLPNQSVFTTRWRDKPEFKEERCFRFVAISIWIACPTAVAWFLLPLSWKYIFLLIIQFWTPVALIIREIRSRYNEDILIITPTRVDMIIAPFGTCCCRPSVRTIQLANTNTSIRTLKDAESDEDYYELQMRHSNGQKDTVICTPNRKLAQLHYDEIQRLTGGTEDNMKAS